MTHVHRGVKVVESGNRVDTDVQQRDKFVTLSTPQDRFQLWRSSSVLFSLGAWRCATLCPRSAAVGDETASTRAIRIDSACGSAFARNNLLELWRILRGVQRSQTLTAQQPPQQAQNEQDAKDCRRSLQRASPDVARVVELGRSRRPRRVAATRARNVRRVIPQALAAERHRDGAAAGGRTASRGTRGDTSSRSVVTVWPEDSDTRSDPRTTDGARGGS